MTAASRLMALCATIAASLALGASTASATTPIEVNAEGDAHCSGANPCVALAGGEFRLSILGTVAMRCEDTLEVTFGENGTGAISYTNEPHHTIVPPGCNRIACEAPLHPWPITGAEEIAANRVEMVLNFCLENGPGQANQSCTGDVLVDDLGNHNYRLTMNQSCFGGLAQIVGTWTTVPDSTHDDIELTHL